MEESDYLEAEDTLKNRYLIFLVGDELYGIEIRYVIEIINIVPITKVPDLAEHVKGIINLRGNVIPVIDVRLKFKKDEREYDDKTCIVVLEISGALFGLIIDRVNEVAGIDEQDISPPPSINQSGELANEHIGGIGKINNQIILLINCSKLLADNKTGGNEIGYKEGTDYTGN